MSQPNTPTTTTRAARFAAYRTALALERIGATLDGLAASRHLGDELGQVLDEAAAELAHHADALREAHALDAAAVDAEVARLTGRNAPIRN